MLRPDRLRCGVEPPRVASRLRTGAHFRSRSPPGRRRSRATRSVCRRTVGPPLAVSGLLQWGCPRAATASQAWCGGPRALRPCCLRGTRCPVRRDHGHESSDDHMWPVQSRSLGLRELAEEDRRPGERSPHEVAFCCFIASTRRSRAWAMSRLHALSCCSRSARVLRTRPRRAFAPVKRSLRPRVRLFARLRDKITSIAGSAPNPRRHSG